MISQLHALLIFRIARMKKHNLMIILYVTVSVTESGDTALGLAVREGKIDVIKYLVTKCSADVEGE